MKNTNKAKRSMKKGFSLVELVIVIVIMGVLATVLYNSLSSSKDNIELQNSLSTSVRVVSESIAQYRSNNTGAEPYTGVNVVNLAMYIPSKMKFNGTLGTPDLAADYLQSLGLDDGCRFYVAEDKEEAGGTDAKGVKVFMDCSSVSGNWENKDKFKAEQLFVSYMQKYAGSTIVETYNATALGAANAAFTGGGDAADADGNPVYDTMVGVRYFTN